VRDGRPGKYSAARYGDSLVDGRRPAPTVTKIGRLFWDRETELGPESYKAVAGFPAEFRFAGSFSDLKARIGNSVPPPH
jgi:site-specific DNA-cytosine methylase